MSAVAAGAAVLAVSRDWATAGTTGVFDSAWTMLRVLAVLALVVVLALVTTRFLGRRLVVRRPGRHLELVETLALGANRALCLARVGDRLLVLGVSEGGISRLLTLPGPLAASAPGRGPEGGSGTAGDGAPGGAAPPARRGAGDGAAGRPLGPARAGFLGRLLEELGGRGPRRG